MSIISKYKNNNALQPRSVSAQIPPQLLSQLSLTQAVDTGSGCSVSQRRLRRKPEKKKKKSEIDFSELF